MSKNKEEKNNNDNNNKNNDFVRVTRSQTTLADNEKQESIERLKKEISDLTSVDKFLQKSTLLSGIDVAKEIKSNSDEIEKLRKRRSASKTKSSANNKENQEPKDDEKFKYSGYLKYKNSNIFCIIMATLLVLVLFIIISRATLNNTSYIQSAYESLMKLVKKP